MSDSGSNGVGIEQDPLSALQQALAESERRTALGYRMIAMVGHDLRTPLSAIAAGLETLREEPELTGTGRMVLERLARSTAWMSTMVAQLLDLSAIRHDGALAVYPEPGSLRDLVLERVDELRISHPQRVILLDIDGDDEALFDPVALGQVVVNLVSNALEHGYLDSPVEVRLAADDQKWQLTVRNRGEPIPLNEQESIFEPFVRKTRGPGSGLGLGLFISREIARAHGADLRLQSTAADTVFTLLLPHAPRQ